MSGSENQESINEHEIDDSDHIDGSNGGGGGEIGLTERLTEILVEDGDGDLLMQENDREDGVFIQWIQALDMQVMGACRADERLKPLLKLNVSSGGMEDRLLTHLSQHFEPSEVAMLARCLCIPLVSIRVGKINKQGTLLCPTSTRGNLNLTLLPSSDLRISFVGDDGLTERLLTITSGLHCSSVEIEEIPADKSGRSFLIKIPHGQIFYFWCSEKSKLLGIGLLEKMKDLLERKPSLAELSGINESRLECFVIHLRAYLVGSSVTNTQASTVPSTIPFSNTSSDSPEHFQNAQSSSVLLKPSRSRHYSSQGTKPNSLYQGSLSPRSSSFKEGWPRNLYSLRSIAREKLRQLGDSHLSCPDPLSTASSITSDPYISNHSEKDKLPEAGRSPHLFPSFSFLESIEKSADLQFPSLESQVSSIGSSPLSPLSPYYCWCPPIVASSLQCTVSFPQLPILSTESLSLPPLSSLVSATRSSSLSTLKPPLNLSEVVPSLAFPPFLPEPMVRLPLSMSGSQQFPTFTPLICDPIVHIPFIDVCSSGQGYLVSAGSGMSTTIPPLHPKFVNETESVLEKGARETLRLLIGSSSQSNPQLMDVMLPSVLTNIDEQRSMLVSGSRGLYTGATDVTVMANNIAAMGLASLSERSVKRCSSQGDLVDQLEKPGGSSSSNDDEKIEGGND